MPNDINPHSVHEKRSADTIRKESIDDVYGPMRPLLPPLPISGKVLGILFFVIFGLGSLFAFFLTMP